MAENDKFETLGDAFAKYPQSTLVMRKQYVDELNARIADLQKDEEIKQRKCQYCHEGPKQVCGFEKFGDEFYIARIMPDGSMKKEKANLCPKCGRNLET